MAKKENEWHKVLYKDQGTADNFVHSTFLRDLRKNAFIQHFTYKEAVFGAMAVSSEISSACMLFVVHKYLKESLLSSALLIIVLASMTTLCYVWYMNQCKTSFSTDLKSLVIFSTFGYGMSPVLKTLTDTISSDTIHDTSVAMMIGHLIFFEYGTNSVMASPSISFNAAIFCAVCLASRLHSVTDVFVFLTFAVELFAILPPFKKHFKEAFPNHSEVIIFTGSCIPALIGIGSVSIFWAVVLFVVIVFITFICPLWYTRWQKCKDNIHGPWDEAVIDDKDLKENRSS